MSRLVDPTPQYFDGAGDPLPLGLLYFYESETAIEKNTYADSGESIPNSNPVQLDSAGRVPNVFYTGTARVVLRSAEGSQIWERDPVGGENIFANFSPWADFIIYDKNDISSVNGVFYKSLLNGNQGNDPSVDPVNNESWELISFESLYNSNVTYNIGDKCNSEDGNFWRSIVDNNVGNSPAVDDGSNWLPAIDGSKVPEIIDLTNRDDRVIVRSDGDTLTFNTVNELQDSGNYILPLASLVSANEWVDIYISNLHSLNVPTVTCSGSDRIEYSTSSDINIMFDSYNTTFVRLVSDGINRYRI